MVKGNRGKSGGSRPQCQKVLKDIIAEKKGGIAKCNMPLNANGQCPVHGSNIR